MLEAISARVSGDKDNGSESAINIKLRFPGRVFQTGPDSIEVQIEPANMIQPFSEPFMRQIHAMFGAHGGTLWIEEQIARMQRDLLLKQIR